MYSQCLIDNRSLFVRAALINQVPFNLVLRGAARDQASLAACCRTEVAVVAVLAERANQCWKRHAYPACNLWTPRGT